jgi:heme-degrading monooxygenase HmoA
MLSIGGSQEAVMLKLAEMDDRVGLAKQMGGDEAPVVLANVFTVAPEDVDALVEAWTADASLLKGRAGFISTQLHRGIAGSSTFMNYAVWESVGAFRAAFSDPEFQASFARYPDSTVASPHLFQKVAIPGISEGE